MSEKKVYLLCINVDVLVVVQCWVDDELCSFNVQIEYVLCDVLCKVGCLLKFVLLLEDKE